MPWIHHPACQDGPVSIRRWLAWHVCEWLFGWARYLEAYALDDDDLPF